MKLLIITQVIDTEHPILGFLHRWVEEFAKHCEWIHVICLQEGTHHLPKNVTVHSLGKESGKGRFTYLWRFYKLIWSLRYEYDSVFIHMNQIYVILGAPFWRATGKTISLWYVHRQTSLSLRLAVAFAQRVFTSSPESLRIKTNKVLYLGHGVDLNRFSFSTPRIQRGETTQIAYVGRITPIKNIDVLIEAAHLLKSSGSYEFHLYGPANTSEEQTYKSYMKKLIQKYALEDRVIFHGTVVNGKIPQIMSSADLTVNLTPTGGMDKAVIESMAAGVPVLVTNEAFAPVFGGDWSVTNVTYRDPQALAARIEQITYLSDADYAALCDRMLQAVETFSLDVLIQKITDNL